MFARAEHHEWRDEVVEEEHEAELARRPEGVADLAQTDVRHRRVHHREQAYRYPERERVGRAQDERSGDDGLDRIDRWRHGEVRDRYRLPDADPDRHADYDEERQEAEVFELGEKAGGHAPMVVTASLVRGVEDRGAGRLERCAQPQR